MTISVPNEAITDGPTVMWNHIDGPLLEWAGHMHWLTWRERFAILFRRTTSYAIACKRWPHLAALHARLLAKPEPSNV